MTVSQSDIMKMVAEDDQQAIKQAVLDGFRISYEFAAYLISEDLQDILYILMMNHDDDVPKPIDTCGINSFPLIYLCLIHGSANCMDVLIKCGEDVNGKFGGRTLLHNAAIAGEVGVVQCLISYFADPNIADADGNTPLHAVSRGRSSKMRGIASSLYGGLADLTQANNVGVVAWEALRKSDPAHVIRLEKSMMRPILKTGGRPVYDLIDGKAVKIQYAEPYPSTKRVSELKPAEPQPLPTKKPNYRKKKRAVE